MPDLGLQSYLFVWHEVTAHSTTIAFPQLTATNEKLIDGMYQTNKSTRCPSNKQLSLSGHKNLIPAIDYENQLDERYIILNKR